MPDGRDSYLKSPPDSRQFSRRVARIRQKGFHAESRPGEGNELDAAAVYLVDPDQMTVGMRPWGNGKPVWVRDATLDDSDKSFTVPEGKVWDLKLIYAELACTANVGNRALVVSVSNGVNVLFGLLRTGSITAGQSAFVTSMNCGSVTASTGYWATSSLSFADVRVQAIMPKVIMPAGYVIRVYDIGAIDPAADDLTVVLHYVEYDA